MSPQDHYHRYANARITTKMFMKNISVTKHEVVAVAGEKTAIPCDCTPTSSHPGKQDHAADDGYGDGDSDGNSAKYYSS